MYLEKPIETGIIHDSTHLRELIAENPDLPIVVLSDDESCIGDGVSTYMSEVKCHVGELLDCYPIGSRLYRHSDYDQVFDDRGDLKEHLEDVVCDKYEDMSDAEQDEIVEQYLKLYEPYWKKCIIIKTSN